MVVEKEWVSFSVFSNSISPASRLILFDFDSFTHCAVALLLSLPSRCRHQESRSVFRYIPPSPPRWVSFPASASEIRPILHHQTLQLFSPSCCAVSTFFFRFSPIWREWVMFPLPVLSLLPLLNNPPFLEWVSLTAVSPDPHRQYDSV